MDLIEIGRIVNTHGLKGHIKVEPWCDGIETFEYLNSVYIDKQQFKLEGVKVQKNLFLIKLNELNTLEDAESLKNKIIFADKAEMPPLPDGVFYIKDIIGLKVYENEKYIGDIADWIETGANNVYIIKMLNGKDLLIPAIDSVILNIDIENNKMSVKLIEGLMEDDN